MANEEKMLPQNRNLLKLHTSLNWWSVLWWTKCATIISPVFGINMGRAVLNGW